ncbi:extended synaptotagmin-2-A-like [Garra rufa]|uniref:extended synaptotagmin-2-A-like n=1 Tax=Garra rufa TaxID=137080 RepID=UPI003CCEA2B6
MADVLEFSARIADVPVFPAKMADVPESPAKRGEIDIMDMALPMEFTALILSPETQLVRPSPPLTAPPERPPSTPASRSKPDGTQTEALASAELGLQLCTARLKQSEPDVHIIPSSSCMPTSHRDRGDVTPIPRKPVTDRCISSGSGNTPSLTRQPCVTLNMTEDIMTAVRGNLSQTAGASGQKDSGQTEPTNGAIPSTLPAELSQDSPSCTSELSRTWLQFANAFVIIFSIYVLGYFEFSFSWLLIALTIFFFWRRNTRCKNRLHRALSFFEQDDTVKQELETTELPSWVHYPDVERVEWLNKTVKQMWPYVCQFVEKLFRGTIEPAIKEANAHLSTFSFTKVDLGDKPLRINGVKVYSENVDKRQIIMDLQISYVGNTEIDVDVKRYYCRAGIKSIQLHGVLRVILEPLLGNMPLVGALSLFFLKKPLLDINWTGLTNILDIPGLNGFSDHKIQDIISTYMVLPNRITVPLIGEVELAQLRFPMPKGVLRIHFLEAQNLEIKDTYLGGLIKGKSDPYGMLLVSNQLFRSKTIKECLHPKWNEVYEALVYEHSGQHLEIELFDEDPDKDDFLGSLMIDLSELHKEQKVDEWFDLEDVTSGRLHLKLEWLSLYPSAEKLDQVLWSIRTNENLSSALLVVYLDSASNLPSVFEGSFGCGNLKERRASGLVFCENPDSLYRTLFVSLTVICILVL